MSRPLEVLSVEISWGFWLWVLGISRLGQAQPVLACIGVNPTRTSSATATAERDIFFHCDHCKTALVAPVSAAGMNLTCRSCGKLTHVPTPEIKENESTNRLHDIQLKLKENESQRTEVTGYINQLSIQLHRWQLRLQTLNERRDQLEKEQQEAGLNSAR